MSSIYDFTVKDSRGSEVALSDYKGQVMLVVNTASKCGFTPQYKELQQLHDDLNEQGLSILAFPCNQFGQQEAGSNDQIQEFCQINYGLSFPVMGKIDVNTDTADPLYKFSKKEKGGLMGSRIKWNFTKFLVDREGNVIKRYAPAVKPMDIKKDIEALL